MVNTIVENILRARMPVPQEDYSLDIRHNNRLDLGGSIYQKSSKVRIII